jgi:glutamyl-tRNA synthetase
MTTPPIPPRVRLAPSPTGPFHVGTARAALFNFLFARRYGGKFLIRIEDTDRERSTKESEQEILESLNWLGLSSDEPLVRQSENVPFHKTCLEKMWQAEKIYPCFCTKEDLEKARAEQTAQKLPPKYSGKCARLARAESEERIARGEKFVLRFRVPSEPIEFDDLIRGKIREDAALFGDFVVAKNLDEPLFLLSNVADDYAMQITHVIRGEDHISNTPKQILLYRALDFPVPQFAHLPLLLNRDRSKMSKREKGALVRELKSGGIVPEALVNYLALLGWNPGTDQEIFSWTELAQVFSLERVNKSGAVFDYEKLLWFNSHYLKNLPLAELAQRVRQFISNQSPDIPLVTAMQKSEPEYFSRALEINRERLKTLADAPELLKCFLLEPDLPIEILSNEKMKVTHEIAQIALEKSSDVLAGLADFSRDNIETALKKLIADLGYSNGQVLWPLRVALSGAKFSAGAFELANILGREKSLARLKNATEILKKVLGKI